jgi:hypothetical protein
VVGRGDRAKPVERLGEPVAGGGSADPRVQRKHNGQAQFAQLVQHSPQAFGVVGIFRAVDRGQDVLPGLDAEADCDLPGRRLVRQHAERGKIGDGRYRPDCHEIDRKSIYLETQMASGMNLLAAYI